MVRWTLALVTAVVLAPLGSAEASAATTFTITSPARGSFLSGSPNVTVSGTVQPVVAKIEVNGQSAAISGGSWSIPTTLEFGTNIFTLRASDATGADVGHTTWAVVYSPSYVPTKQPIVGGIGVGLSARAAAIAAQPLLSGALRAATNRIPGLTFGEPSSTTTLVQGGVHTSLDIPNVDLKLTVGRFLIDFTAKNAHVDATLAISVANGSFVVTMPQRPAVGLSGFNWNLPFKPTAQITRLVEGAIAAALQSAVPPAVKSELDSTVRPITFAFGGFAGTLDATPSSLAIDPANVRAVDDANVTVQVAGATPHTGPGSPSRGSGQLPPFASAHDLSVSISERILNRATYAAWSAGALDARIDQAWVAAHGIAFPFPLDASYLVPFFPALANLKPGGGPMPVVFALDPQLPPVVTLTGGPSLLALGLGELHFGVLIDLGQGFVSVLDVAVHAQLGVTPTIVNGELRLALGQPSRLETDILADPLGLPEAEVNRFIQFLTPSLFQITGTMIPPIPLPPLSFGAPWQLAIRVDGAQGEYVTISGDL